MEKDKEIFDAIKGEEKRQREGLELIPSENYVSQNVKDALASVLTNKYSEGYPGKRYYGGQEFTDTVERIAIDRACTLFKAKSANVQPHSGAPANEAVFHALMEPGDTILGMELSHGGHLTHGSSVTIGSKIFNFVRYGVSNTETGDIDYDELREIALREKPKVILAGYSSYTRELDYKKIVDIALEIGAYTVMDAAHIAGLIAGGVHQNPFDYGFDVMTSTTHKTLRGPRGGIIIIRDNKEIAQKIDKAVFPGLQGGPHMNTIAAKAICFSEALNPSFKRYTEQIITNTKAMEEVFENNNVTMVFGGSSNHLLLIDTVSAFGIGGKEAQEILDSIGITVNMNIIPNDERSPMDPSGIRLGTPALTTRGFKIKECERVAEIIVETLKNKNKDFKKEIKELALKHPIPKSFT